MKKWMPGATCNRVASYSKCVAILVNWCKSLTVTVTHTTDEKSTCTEHYLKSHTVHVHVVLLRQTV